MEQNTPTPSDLSPKTPLPVAAIIQEAFTLPWKYKKTLFLVGLPFLIVWVVGNAFTIMMLTNTQDPDAISGTWLLLSLIAFIVSIIASVYAVVRFHRIFVLEDTQTAMQSESWWSYREWRFLGWLIATGFIMMIVSMVPMFVVMFISQELITSVQNPTLADIENSNLQMSLLSNIAYLPGMFVVSQLSLVLPASALDKPRDLGWAWVKTEGNRFRVFLLLGLIPILISLVSYLIPEYESLWLTLVVLAIGIYLMTFEIALLSLCYHELCKDDADADEDRTTHTDEKPRDHFEA